MNKLIERIGLVTMSTALSSAIVLHQTESQSSASEVKKTLRVERLEVVDSEGKPGLVLASGKNGGNLTIRRPSRGEGAEEIIGFIGSTFESGVEIFLRDPSPGGKARLRLDIRGEPSYSSVSASDVNGKPSFSLGGIGSDKPKLRLWHIEDKEPYFSK